MRIKESKLRQIIRNVLLEEYPPPGSGAPDDQDKAGTLVDWDDDDIDQKIPIGSCEPKEGAPVVFHGLGMVPCGDGGMHTGAMGPYLGGPDIEERKIYPHEIEDAISYIEKYKPSEIFAYSRGGAVAIEVLKQGASLPAKQSWMAPALGRAFGPMPEDAAAASGVIYIGGRDDSVSLMSMIIACQANSSLELYVHPWISHKSLIYARSYKFKGFEKIDPQIISNVKEGDLPTWDQMGYATADQINEQIKWLIKNTKTEWKEKKGFEEVRNSAMAERNVTETIRALIRSLLIEKKDVKCPLKNGKRDYKCEYQKYGGASKKGKKDRAARNQARKVAEREGKVKKGDGKEIDHKKPLSKGGSNAKSNQRVVSRATNRKKGNS
tara:strand:+ start:49 stop:1188 length:1140 start_codon:yes stop_codon:yes gene_type:complete